MSQELCEGCGCYLDPCDTFVVSDSDGGQPDIKVCGACKDLDDMYSQEGACVPQEDSFVPASVLASDHM